MKNNNKGQQTIFNIYYINLPKVYEIRMMLDNKILSYQSVEKDRKLEGSGKVGANLDIFNFLKLGGFNAEGKIEGGGSQKVLETFEIKTTKSVILSEVINIAEDVKDFESLREGQLIKIDNVKLSLENEDELRIIKFINSGAFKDLMPQESKGMDLNNIFNSMFKDYAYKIKGRKGNLTDSLLIKIPLSFQSEFESSYSVDDLFIGNVSLLGLYKGKIKKSGLKNSFEYFKEIGDLQNRFGPTKNGDTEDIQDSYYPVPQNTFYLPDENDDEEFYYIDLLAIIQNVEILK